MTIVERLSLPKVRHAVPVASVATFFASATIAGDLTETVVNPEVVSPNRIGSDVSAFYLGVSGAYGLGGDDRFGLTTPGGTFAIGEQDLTGNYGGIRGGWRGILPFFGGREYVYGVEIGYDFGSLEDDVATQVSGTPVQGGSRVSDVLSLRLRSGFTNRSRSVLYFATVGYVRGDVETTNSFGSGSAFQAFRDTDTRNGFSASIGAEHRLNENWSITGEYEYVQFQSEVIQFESGFSTKSTPNYRGLRFGLNYTF